MKVIFLDIDGVLNTGWWYTQMDRNTPKDKYGNGLFDYFLGTEDGEEELWNSKEGYDVLILGENCELAI